MKIGHIVVTALLIVLRWAARKIGGRGPCVSDEQLIELKERAAAQFLRIPGVTAVGLGGRERDGRPTGEVVLKVFVERKRPAAELTPGQLLPPEFEGVGVDVVELPEPTLEVAAPPQPGSPGTSVADLDSTEFRPLKGGGCVQVALSGAGLGTLGCFLTDPADPAKVYALTNFHVVNVKGGAQPVAGTTRLGQPDNQDGPTKCCSHLIGTFAAGSENTVRDAAVIRLDGGTKWLAEITEIGIVTGTHTLTVAEVAPLTYQVRKRGMRTGLTGGIVEALNTQSTIDGNTRNNVIVVKPNPNAGVKAGGTLFFSDHGDSGSAVVNASNEIVALHFAGSTAGLIHKGLELPIADILTQFRTVDALTLAVATATDKGQVKTVPGPAPVAPQPVLAPGFAMALAVAVPARTTPRTMAVAAPGATAVMSRVGADLGTSTAGLALRALWFDHSAELVDLVTTRRRVTLAWHRDGGPALVQCLYRMAADATATMPATINGEPPMARIMRIHAVLRANASPELRDALDLALAALPDPATHSYDQLLAALAAR
jgi:hypothetical protein